MTFSLIFVFAFVGVAARCNLNDTAPIKELTFFRNCDNDTYARVLQNNNLASLLGEAVWLCDAGRKGAVISTWNITVDTRWADYARCNKGSCPCSPPSAECTLGVGRAEPGLTSPTCMTVMPHGEWFSFPAAGECSAKVPVGTKNCTWSSDYKLVKSITLVCLDAVIASGGGKMRNSCVWSSIPDITALASFISKAFQTCPDVSKSLVPAPGTRRRRL